MVGLFTRHLYVRIWLAVLAGVAVVALAAGWAWQMADEQRAAPLPREVVLRVHARCGLGLRRVERT